MAVFKSKLVMVEIKNAKNSEIVLKIEKYIEWLVMKVYNFLNRIIHEL